MPARPPARARRRRARYALRMAGGAGPRLYEEIDTVVSARLTTGIDEFDRVLGGGVVPGRWCSSAASRASASRRCCCRPRRTSRATTGPVLYSSGEESEHQIKSRGERLGVERAPLYLLAETCLERILEEIARLRPALVIVDSIQTVFSLKFQSAPAASVRCAKPRRSCCSPPKGRTSRPSWSATSPRTAASPARRCSSTSSTPCSTSRGKSITRTGSCAPSRTGSAR